MATYYVSATTGDDSNNGTAVATPKATIGAGEDLATTAGDIVYIAPGTYREQVSNGHHGAVDNRIYFIGDPDCEIFGDAVSPGVVRVTAAILGVDGMEYSGVTNNTYSWKDGGNEMAKTYLELSKNADEISIN